VPVFANAARTFAGPASCAIDGTQHAETANMASAHERNMDSPSNEKMGRGLVGHLSLVIGQWLVRAPNDGDE